MRVQLHSIVYFSGYLYSTVTRYVQYSTLTWAQGLKLGIVPQAIAQHCTQRAVFGQLTLWVVFLWQRRITVEIPRLLAVSHVRFTTNFAIDL